MSDNSTIKEQMAQLRERISWFESDDFSLEQAEEKFKEAQQLTEEIKQKLTALKSDVTVLEQTFDDAA